MKAQRAQRDKKARREKVNAVSMPLFYALNLQSSCFSSPNTYLTCILSYFAAIAVQLTYVVEVMF
jgi:hypothetical protein